MSQPFNFTWETSSPQSDVAGNISVLFTYGYGSFGSGGRSVRLIDDLAPTGTRENGYYTIYSTSLTPHFFYESPLGNYEIDVLEYYDAYLVGCSSVVNDSHSYIVCTGEAGNHVVQTTGHCQRIIPDKVVPVNPECHVENNKLDVSVGCGTRNSASNS